MTENTTVERIIATALVGALLVGWVLMWGGALWGIWVEATEMTLAEQLVFTGIVVMVFTVLPSWLYCGGRD